MTHEETSLQTKLTLCNSLKKIMKQKPFSKITVSELIKDCNLNRKTFYYHFEDVYALLLCWMFQEEGVALLDQQKGALLWQEGLLQLFRYIEENRSVCLCALKSVGRQELKRFFEADIHAIIYRTVEQLGSEVGAIQAGITKDDIDLMTHFYILACVGLLESWLLGEIDRTPEELIAFLDRTLKEHICGARICWSEAIKEHTVK